MTPLVRLHIAECLIANVLAALLTTSGWIKMRNPSWLWVVSDEGQQPHYLMINDSQPQRHLVDSHSEKGSLWF